MNSDLPMIKLLLNQGADLGVVNKLGQTVFNLASSEILLELKLEEDRM
jgi:ankyrin repeat protein